MATKVAVRRAAPAVREARVQNKVAYNRIADATKDFLISLPLKHHEALQKEAKRISREDGSRPNMSRVMRMLIEKEFGIKPPKLSTPVKEKAANGNRSTPKTVKSVAKPVAKPAAKPVISRPAPAVRPAIRVAVRRPVVTA